MPRYKVGLRERPRLAGSEWGVKVPHRLFRPGLEGLVARCIGGSGVWLL